MIFFSSRTIASTKAAPAAPGAYQADVPKRPVKVAPPTIVSATTLSNVSASKNWLTGTPLYVAKRFKGIIVVSPCPPITVPEISLMETSMALAK